MLRLTAWIALGVLVAGCSGTVGKDEVRSAGGSITGLTVSGKPGSSPVVRMAAPLKDTGSDVVVEGTGPVLMADQQLILNLSSYDPETGKRTRSSYDPGEHPQVVRTSTIAPELAQALVGQRQGSRVVVAEESVVLVADIVAVPPETTLDIATGEEQKTPAGLPAILERDGAPSALAFTAAGPEPADLVVVPLIEGDGPKVRDESLVTVRSISQVWGRATPFDDTFAKEPTLVPIGLGSMVRAWDRSLVGVRRGTRLLVIAPASYAFGTKGLPSLSVPPDATICYVIDVLGVS